MSSIDLDQRIPLDRRGRSAASRFHPAVWVLTPLAAVLFQVYVPLYIAYLSYLELPLLVTVYFSLMRRQPASGAVFGAAVGLVQDALSQQPIGMFGISKTLVGYFAASISMRFDVDNRALRFMLSFVFFLFHQLFFWIMTRALLGQALDLKPAQAIIFAFLNAVVSLPLCWTLDKLKLEGR
jgi:rod shape-determining protein MreD